MKKPIKIALLSGFPAITVILCIAIIICSTNIGIKFKATEASDSDGIIYADYFTGNSAHYEWQFEYTENSKSPKFVNDMMLLDGFSSLPSFAMLQYTLPEKCDIYFTAEVARRGEGENRDPAVFLNIGDNRFMLFLKEKTVTLSYNGTKDLVNKRAENLTVGQANSFRLSLEGAKLTLYIDGSKEPLLTYSASQTYANLAQARNFGIWGTASEFYFDDFIVTNGKDLIAVNALEISGNSKSYIEGIGTQMQMQAFLNPINSTDRAVVWSVDNEDIAEITSGGLITAKNYGTITVTARTRDGSGIKATCKIKIKKVSGAKSHSEAAVAEKSWDLADNYSKVFESDDPHYLYPMSPYVTVLKSGRIIVTFDLNGDGLKKRTPIGYTEPQDWNYQHVVVAFSDDNGKTWNYGLECPGLFPRAFEDGGRLYLIRRNEKNQLAVNYSEDEGKTWSESFTIDERGWHSAPTSIIYKGDYLYMTMEVNENGSLAPILMRAKCGDDLTKKESWTFSKPMTLEDIIPDSTTQDLDYTGIMEYSKVKTGLQWLEGNVIQMFNKDSSLYDESMNSFYIILRSQVYRSGYAAILRVTENSDGSMTPNVIKTKAGNSQLFVAMPGGQDKFSIIYEEKSELYWLSSNLSYNSILNRK